MKPASLAGAVSMLLAGCFASVAHAQPWMPEPADTSRLGGSRPAPTTWEEAAALASRSPALPARPHRPAADRAAPPASASSGYEAEWVPIWLADPTGRENPAGVVDPVRDRFLFFGGYDGQYENDTWALSLGESPSWTRLEPEGDPPPPRDRHSMIYDPAGDRLIVFGGWDGAQTFDDVWALELAGGGRWVRLQPQGDGPPPRAVHAAVYDSRRHRMLVQGGTLDYQSWYADLWSLSLDGDGSWEQLFPGGMVPAARGFHVAAYDSVGDRLVTYGGMTSLSSTYRLIHALALGGPLSWIRWTPELFTGAPDPVGGVMITDPERRQLVVHRGGSGETTTLWGLSLDYPVKWLRLEAGASRLPRFLHTAALDARRGRLISFGGAMRSAGAPHEFSFEDSTWSPLAPLRVEPQSVMALAYDPDQHRIVAMGGDASIWTMSLSGPPRWRGPFIEGPLPPYRGGFGLAYDHARRRFLMHGGFLYEPGQFNDTWALSAVEPFRWDSLTTSGEVVHGPQGFGMTLDPARRRLVTYGGTYDYDSFYGDRAAVLELEPSSTWWEPVARSPLTPGRRANCALVCDPVGDRILMFGGYRDGISLLDLWSMSIDDSATWQELPQTGFDGTNRLPRSWTVDAPRQRLLASAYEMDGLPTYGELWATDFATAGAWRPLATHARIPPPQYYGANAHDPIFDRYILNASGTTNGNPTRWWELRFHSPTATAVSLVSATASADAIRIVWRALARSERYAVERHTAVADWHLLGPILTDPDGMLRWEDREVEAGVTYRYRLRCTDRGNDQLAAETPELSLARFATRLALGGTHPVRDAARLRVSLAGGAGARLDVLDVAGRRVTSIDLEGLPAGDHELEWRDARRLGSGLYFLRLREGAATASARMLVVR